MIRVAKTSDPESLAPTPRPGRNRDSASVIENAPVIDNAHIVDRAHVIDQLIEERAPVLSRHPVWPILRPALYAILDYRKARTMADAIAPLDGRQALEHVLGLLSLNVTIEGLGHIPAAGPFIVAVNHPTGIGDGVALYEGLGKIRKDMVFFANADAFRVCPGFGDVLIPVEWRQENRSLARTRIILGLAQKTMEDGKALVVFPAGKLARRIGGVLVDPKWESSVISLARRHQAPILPVFMTGPAARLFHFFNRFSPELRDMTLFHELLNKRGRRFRLRFGPPIPPDRLTGDPIGLTQRLKTFVERDLAAYPEAVFQP